MTKQAGTKSKAGKKSRSGEVKSASERGRKASPDAFQSTPIDDDLDALQHEVHGMIEDAQAPGPQRSGTNIQTE